MATPTPEILHQLCFRLDRLEYEHRRLANYDSGAHPLAFASDKYQSAFGQNLRALADNFIPTVVDALRERLQVQGFRFGANPSADTDAWQIWQDNLLDRDSRLAHRDALLYGRSFLLVWPDNDGRPRITVESPRQCLTMAAPGNRRGVVAGVKRWLEFDGTARAFLYLPDRIVEFNAPNLSPMDASGATDPAVEPRSIGQLTVAVEWTEVGEVDNPLGKVPLVPMFNNPTTIGSASSEVEPILPLQDLLNKVVGDMIVASEFASFRQRWATGVEIPVDPETQQPLEPFGAAVSRVWTSESDQAKFGTFEATDLSNYTKAIETIVQHICSISRLPAHYVSASADRLSGESIKSSEAGLVSKVKDKMGDFGEAWETALRLAFAILGDARADETSAETIWSDPEVRTEAEHVAALVQLQAIGVPDQQLWSDAGYSPQAIERFRAMQRAAALDSQTLGLTALVAPTPPPPVVPHAPAGEGPESEPGEPTEEPAA